jgi:UDP-N-acetylmuramate dehydrogenase
MVKQEELEQKIIFDEPMKKHTSFKIGGTADYFFKATTLEELQNIIKFAKIKELPITIIGNGSNLLVTDKGIRGLVIKIDIKKLKIEKKDEFAVIEVGAGNKLMALATKMKDEELSGLEGLSGIPGSVGGAIVMNAGAYGKEMKDVVLSTTCMDKNGKLYTFSNEEQEFSYRNSIFQKKDYIIIETKLKLEYGKKDEIQKKMEEYFKSRKEKQPIKYPSAGSSFKRQEGIITAKLIDDVGLKGYKIGGAQVSEKHAGFIVNYNNATATDVINLIDYIKEKVYSKYGIKIEEEIKIIGER